MPSDPDQTMADAPAPRPSRPPSGGGQPAADETLFAPGSVSDSAARPAAGSAISSGTGSFGSVGSGTPAATDSSHPSHPAHPTHPSHPAHRLPAGVGPYRILGLLGEGGMGQVLKAEQLEPVRRVVALKVIKLGMDSREVVARFQAERQALAMMDHPSVAKVYDAGVTERGQPYFAMELVQGVPLNQYCDEHRLGTRQRLRLFAEVCNAVQHAHQKGIIHRDLKPSNILVGEVDGKPVPKVIDFGIAKATGEAADAEGAAGPAELVTRGGLMVGTLAYMSPEQAAGSPDIDTRTDVYSLGVVLYELLTGVLPLDPTSLRSAGLDAVRIIRESDPPKPSTRLATITATAAGAAVTATAAGALASAPAAPDETSRPRHGHPRALSRELRGDLDWITLKAIEKDRSRRYATANALAADVHRYLDDEPVSARPPTLSYRLGKLARRHKAAVAAVLAVAVALVAGMAGTTVGFVRARAERDKAVAAHDAMLRQQERAEKSERERKLRLVDELMDASPRRVPELIESLRSVPELVTPILRARFDDPSAPPQQKLRAAYALAACEKAAPAPQGDQSAGGAPASTAPSDGAPASAPPDDVRAYLVDRVFSTATAESENLIAALRRYGPSAAAALKAQSLFQLTPENMRRTPQLARYAFTLLSLGDPVEVDVLMKTGPDCVARTAAVHAFASWHGDVGPAADYVRSDGIPPDSRSGLCAALGTLELAWLRGEERRAVAQALHEVYRNAPDAGSHSAAGWALRQWGLALPNLPRGAGAGSARDWFVNSAGMTMLRLPDYRFTPAEELSPPPPEKVVSLADRPFFICDRETTIAAFETFAKAPDLTDDERPADWPGPDRAVGPSDDCPVQMVNLDDAVRFCNWLSRRERRRPYYVRRGDGWAVNPAGSFGYRLPHGAEWECACRAGTTTPFPFGDDLHYLPDFVVIGQVRDLPCGSKQPNPWGLFDMLGNAWEMTWQNATNDTPTLREITFGEPTLGPNLVMRGGSYDGGTAYTRPGVLVPNAVGRRAASVGFRVVVSAPRPKPSPAAPAVPPSTRPATGPAGL